ncbi:hypothetical protein LO771_06815 [Streptacidiphilus sp. ASG 303]|uniref:hypothetical protein n=1 Tax=Streptacidiphilus sp. ASG 303 TaxID=2896847 RepID=UPI001E4C2685|nr:hypothetical protein [Streptacidiphilus sp. ASG 303]MCD0482135.1 hypothetical protein [Streptacidiphilus sp. ASG 303]
MTVAERTKLRSLLWDLSDLADDIDPFGRDDTGPVVLERIADTAEQAAALARDLVATAHNTAAENGEGV